MHRFLQVCQWFYQKLAFTSKFTEWRTISFAFDLWNSDKIDLIWRKCALHHMATPVMISMIAACSAFDIHRIATASTLDKTHTQTTHAHLHNAFLRKLPTMTSRSHLPICAMISIKVFRISAHIWRISTQKRWSDVNFNDELCVKWKIEWQS